MDNTRSNLDELQNKLTEVRVIPTFNILRHMSKTKNRAMLLQHIFQPQYRENVCFVHFCITGNSFLIIAFHLVNFANVYILYFQIYIISMQNIKKRNIRKYQRLITQEYVQQNVTWTYLNIIIAIPVILLRCLFISQLGTQYSFIYINW